MTKKIAFIILPEVELLDLAGPLQVFREAMFNGLKAELGFYSWDTQSINSAGISLGNLKHYRDLKLNPGDYVIIPGLYLENLERSRNVELPFFEWLRNCYERKVILCSVCTAAFVLGEAGLLDDKKCTTHWRAINYLKSLYPKAKVMDDVLFVKDDNLYTSAGISAGIDMALDILEDWKGPLFTHQVARGLVLYQRRSSQHQQKSIYVDYRNHINPKIHQLQDYLVDNIGADNSIENLASMVSMSPRNLTRVFKEKTGITILDYLTKLRIEKAKTLLHNPDNTIENIASQCGFKSSRQLQRILKIGQ
jgi:transcriptional regulator GlxA family with amidase domain